MVEPGDLCRISFELDRFGFPIRSITMRGIGIYLGLHPVPVTMTSSGWEIHEWFIDGRRQIIWHLRDELQGIKVLSRLEKAYG